MNLIKYSIFFVLVFVTFSCKKDKPIEPEMPATLKNGMLVLNEGLFQLNNSTLSWVNLLDGSIDNDFFTNKTGRQLGDTGNDMQKYGGKIYIVVNVSSTIEVLDANSGESIQQITMNNGTVGKQPRAIEFYKNHAYVSCFDGYVDVIDTATLAITQRIQVGSNPDHMTVSGNHLFVSNSGGLNAPLMDSTVSVIDMNSQTEITKIKVGLNPGSIQASGNGNVYVIARGNYGSIPSKMIGISIANLNINEMFNFEVSSISAFGDKLLLSTLEYGTNTQRISLFDPISNTVTNPVFIPLTQVQTLYNVQYVASQNKIYVLDAKGYTNTGYVYEYSASGTLLNSYHVGLNPNSILIL